MPPTIHAAPRRLIARCDFRHGLRRFSMRNEAMAYYDAHPEAWAELMAISDDIEREYGPPPPLPPYAKFSLRGETFRTAERYACTPRYGRTEERAWSSTIVPA